MAGKLREFQYFPQNIQNQQQQPQHKQMKPVVQIKHIPNSRKLINLQQVSIDVQTTQKALSHNPVYSQHIAHKPNPATALHYDSLLNETISNLLISISEGSTDVDFSQLTKLLAIEKKEISYVAVLNLQLVQKLMYILKRGDIMGAIFDWQLVRLEIRYWREFVMYALGDTSEERRVYGRKDQEGMTEGEIKMEPSKEKNSKIKEQMEQVSSVQASTGKDKANQNKIIRVPKNKTTRSSSKNNSIQVQYDLLDS